VVTKKQWLCLLIVSIKIRIILIILIACQSSCKAGAGVLKELLIRLTKAVIAGTHYSNRKTRLGWDVILLLMSSRAFARYIGVAFEHSR
jgi:hypothetical protein